VCIFVRRACGQFLFAGAACLRLSTNFKFQMVTLRNVLRIVGETIKELALNRGFRPMLLLFLLAKLLEFEPLQIDLLQALHARVLHDTFECAL